MMERRNGPGRARTVRRVVAGAAAAVIVLTGGTAIAPFIYTLF